MNDVFSQNTLRQSNANVGSYRNPPLAPLIPQFGMSMAQPAQSGMPRLDPSGSPFNPFASGWINTGPSQPSGAAGVMQHTSSNSGPNAGHVGIGSVGVASRLGGGGYGSPKAVKLPDDPVSLLNYYVSKNCLPPARFELLNNSGPAHDPQFTMQVCIADRKFGPFEARNTKILKKICAAHALRNYFAVECEIPSSSTTAATAADAAKPDSGRLPENAIQRLTQLTQLLRAAPPQFSVVTDLGPPHKKLFEIRCDVQFENLRVGATGRGSSKQDAKTDSATQTLQQLEVQGLTLERARAARDADKHTAVSVSAVCSSNANAVKSGEAIATSGESQTALPASAGRKLNELESLKVAADVREALRSIGTTKNYVQLLYEIATALKRSVTFCCEEEADTGALNAPRHRLLASYRAYWTVGDRPYSTVAVSSPRKQDAKLESAARTIELLVHELRGDSQPSAPAAAADDATAGGDVSTNAAGANTLPNANEFIFTQPKAKVKRVELPLSVTSRIRRAIPQRGPDPALVLGRESPSDVRTDVELDLDIDFDADNANTGTKCALLVEFADRVQQLAVANFGQSLARFASTPFAFPPDRVRHVVAAVVMSTRVDSKLRVQLVALGAGRRTVHGDCLDADGVRIYDSHAEVLARRGFLRFLLSELRRAAASNADAVFERDADGFRLKHGVHFHMYVSTAPCGDARCFAPLEADPQWAKLSQAAEAGKAVDGDAIRPRSDEPSALVARHEPQFAKPNHGALRCKVENGEGTVPSTLTVAFDGSGTCTRPPQVQVPSVVPTWDGLLGGEQLLTMSCSDKLAKWNALGLQGNLLSHLLHEPLYLRSLIIGDRGSFRPSHIVRAICCRLDTPTESDAAQFEAPYRVQHPLIVACSQPPALRSRYPPTACCVMALNWNSVDAAAGGPPAEADGRADWRVANALELLDSRTGLLLTDTAHAHTLFDPDVPVTMRHSRLTRRSLFADFVRLCDALNNDSKTADTLRQRATTLLAAMRADVKTYAEVKRLATAYQRAQRVLLSRTRRYGVWLPKPIELATSMVVDVDAALANRTDNQ